VPSSLKEDSALPSSSTLSSPGRHCSLPEHQLFSPMTQHHISEDLNLQLQGTSEYVADNHTFTLNPAKLTLCSSGKSSFNVGGYIPENGNIH
jgi:hypothetical protein